MRPELRRGNFILDAEIEVDFANEPSRNCLSMARDKKGRYEERVKKKNLKNLRNSRKTLEELEELKECGQRLACGYK